MDVEFWEEEEEVSLSSNVIQAKGRRINKFWFVFTWERVKPHIVGWWSKSGGCRQLFVVATWIRDGDKIYSRHIRQP